MSRTILEVSGLSMRFGGLLAVNGVGLNVKEKQVVSMIGPNGAGKTTVFNCLTGFYKPTEGMIRLAQAGGETYLLERLPGHDVNRLARVARTSRATGHLGQLLRQFFAGAEVGREQALIDTHHHHQGQLGQVVALGQDLRADQDAGLVAQFRQLLFQRVAP